jgi:hypothetical protein
VGGRWPCNLKKDVCINVRATWLDWHLASLSTPGRNYHAQLRSCNACIGGNSRRGLSSEYCFWFWLRLWLSVASFCGLGQARPWHFGASGSTSSIDECTSSFHDSNPKRNVPCHSPETSIGLNMVTPSAARLMQATRAKMMRPTAANQWG